MLISRREAKAQGLKRYNGGRLCRKRHIADRYVSDGSCVTCAKERATSRYDVNQEQIKKSARDEYAKNPQKYRDRVRIRCAVSPDKARQESRREYRKHKEAYVLRAKTWALNNPDKARGSSRKWSKTHPGAANAATQLRRARLAQRTPRWLTNADLRAISKIYSDCAKVTADTGVSHQVDHIIPLYGRRVSGLHVPRNLQILPARDNRKKSNKYLC